MVEKQYRKAGNAQDVQTQILTSFFNDGNLSTLMIRDRLSENKSYLIPSSNT
jgi:hypothetical protein